MKKVLSLLVVCMLGMHAFAQEFRHGAGTGVMVQAPELGDAEGLATLLYYPRVNFPVSNNAAVSVGVPLTFALGSSFSWGSSVNSTSISFAFNAPVTADFNFGAGAVKNNGKRFGFFAGAGFGYHYATFREDVDYSDYGSYTAKGSGAGVGPAGDAGVRFKVGQRNHNIEIRASYMRTISDNVYDVFGLNCLFNF
ncbi:hypothetical protein [Chitinophaga sp. CB10]|uniref:outer membrane beta-barrel protein n=1 Tax=Chitinophaga sp. CB10 TaxID=1891659 RepID=UPI0025BF810D|nr:hypothetical protein [Chitinophaga sp. CB10]